MLSQVAAKLEEKGQFFSTVEGDGINWKISHALAAKLEFILHAILGKILFGILALVLDKGLAHFDLGVVDLHFDQPVMLDHAAEHIQVWPHFDMLQNVGVVDRIEIGDQVLHQGFADVQVLADYFVCYYQSRGRAELRTVFLLVYLVFSPDLLQFLRVEVRIVAPWYILTNLIPDGLQWMFSDKQVPNPFEPCLPMLEVHIIAEIQSFQEHEPQHQADITVQCFYIVLIFLLHFEL